jgi:hypothetical protein
MWTRETDSKRYLKEVKGGTDSSYGCSEGRQSAVGSSLGMHYGDAKRKGSMELSKGWPDSFAFFSVC